MLGAGVSEGCEADSSGNASNECEEIYLVVVGFNVPDVDCVADPDACYYFTSDYQPCYCGLPPCPLTLDGDGNPSWAERMMRLRDRADLGPFRLAYLEAVLRAADRRASKRAEERKDTTDA